MIQTQTIEGAKAISYDVKKSIETVMLNQEGLTNVELLQRAKVADKILQCDGFVLLEESEFALVKKSFDSFRGFKQSEVELCKRIAEAEDVKVKEEKKK